MVLTLHFFEPLLPCFLLTLNPDSSVSCDLVSFFIYPLIPIKSRHLIPVIFSDFGRVLLNQLVLLLDGMNGIICIPVLRWNPAGALSWGESKSKVTLACLKISLIYFHQEHLIFPISISTSASLFWGPDQKAEVATIKDFKNRIKIILKYLWVWFFSVFKVFTCFYLLVLLFLFCLQAFLVERDKKGSV